DNDESYTFLLDPRVRLMTRRRPALFVWLFLLAPGTALWAAPPAPAPPISGIVSHMERPISGALVVFYNVDEATLTRSRTASDGTFVVVSAPPGVYDLIAVKKGYQPAVQRVWHQADARQVSAVHIELAALSTEAKRQPVSESLWELRDRLPGDVLREIEIEETSPPQAAGNRLHSKSGVAGEVRAVGDLATSDSAVARTALDVRGGLPNGWRYDLRGDYSALTDPNGNSGAIVSDNSGTTTGNAAGLALDVATSPLDRLSVQTRRNTLSFHDEGPA